MSEQKLLFLDIEPKETSSARTQKPLWTRSDNSFRFDFLSDSSPAPPEETPRSSDETKQAGPSQVSYTGQGSFSFNFQIPPSSPVEDMETTETPDISSKSAQEEKPSPSQEVKPLPEPSQAKKKKKNKKKPANKKPADGAEKQQKPGSAEGSQGGEESVLSVEEQLNRQLDWCIEQLELGMRSQKATPKQKEEASRALKTLRSSKAPLAKKRQVMRAMTGDYRKKMEEEKTKQYKLIQNELASAQVKVVSCSPKKSVFHRKAEIKSPTADTEKKLQQLEVKDSDSQPQTQEETPAFVFVPSKEEFRFNFL